MKLNFDPSRKVAFIDYETQSQQELTTAHKYARHPTTRALTCCIKVDGVMHRFGPYLSATDKQTIAAIASERVLVAHNAPFDAAIHELCEGLPEAEWMDTLPCARAAGLPGGLDKLSLAVGGHGKNKNGKRLIDMLCILKNSRIPAIGPAHQLLLDYNAQDVEELELVYEKVKDYAQPEAMVTDRIINDRGVPVDRDFLLSMENLYAINETKLSQEFEGYTDGINPRSPKQMQAWLDAMGFPMTSTNRNTLKFLISDPEKYWTGGDIEGEMEERFAVVRDAVVARRELVRVGGGKIAAALGAIEDDGRVRDQFVYYGAGPGRWTSRQLQMHNMPLPKDLDVSDLELTYEAVVARAEREATRNKRQVPIADVLNGLLRTMVRSDNLLIADWAAIEARCLAWMSRSPRMLALYADPKQSVYLDMGDKLFQRRISKADAFEYALVKAIVLGCGYGMGAVKFDHLFKTRSAVAAKVLEGMGIRASEAVKVYRQTYPEIPALWQEAGRAALEVVKSGCTLECGRCVFYMRNGCFHIRLPSGRPIVYRNARIEQIVPGYQKMYNMPERPIDTVTYDHPRDWDAYLYGSKIVENMAQGCCRDFLAQKLVESEQAGFSPIFHVHDEIGNDAPDSRFEEFMELISTAPEWAPDFPLLAEGISGPRWAKKGCRELFYMRGKKV